MKLLFLILLISTVLQSKISNSVPKNNYKLVFEDNFEFFDDKKWEYEENFRNSAQNTRKMVRAENGNLIITTENKNNNYKSAIVKSKFQAKNGFWETRIKFGKINKGIWVASWLWSANHPNNYEIDLLEKRDWDINNKDISGYITSAVHWGDYSKNHKSIGNDSGDLDLDQNYHIYGLEITDETITFFIDRKQYWRVSNKHIQPPENPMFFIFSAEMSNFVEGWVENLPKQDFKEDVIFVDWIRFYQKEK